MRFIKFKVYAINKCAIKQFFVFTLIFITSSTIQGYGLPYLNLGLSSFLDGGPLRPRPGWYFQHLLQTYYSNKFLDNQGVPLIGIQDPQFTALTGISQVIYQFTERLGSTRARPGISLALPIRYYSHINENALGITSTKGA